ncbi:MAG: hypothetical protein WD557_13955 [Dehalococcoidia bacterium]
MVSADEVERHRSAYADAAAANGRWIDSGASPENANREFDRIIAAYLALSDTEEGRAALAQLASHDDEWIACWAASHCLWFEIDLARARLTELANAASSPFVRIGARWTLKEFDEGNLRDPRVW